MKNKLTLSELRNVIKEEIQFQLTKKQLFENLDRKTLRRILKEEDAETADFFMTIKNIKVNYNTENTSGFAIISNNTVDKFKAVAAKITESYFMFNITFTLTAPKSFVKDGKLINTQISNFITEYLRKNIYKFTDESLEITNYAAPITVDGEKITIKSASIEAAYPEGISKDLKIPTNQIFNVKNFKGEPTL